MEQQDIKKYIPLYLQYNSVDNILFEEKTAWYKNMGTFNNISQLELFLRHRIHSYIENGRQRSKIAVCTLIEHRAPSSGC